MPNIQKQSRRVRFILQCFMLLLPIMVCYFWLTVNTPDDYLTHLGIINLSFDINKLTHVPLSLLTRLLALIASLALSSIVIYALWNLVKLFRNYEQCDIFSLENAKLYQKLGYSVFYWVIGSIVYKTVIILILSFNNPPGQRLLAISFGGADLLTLLFGLIIMIISWVMKEGYMIADENLHTV
ncbi:DUF2975 domain-containing protein [Vibrio marisflavi]|uniref:DUF2975 domain-containing protein n=1 Tax=Vibrio marisflavi CECT 7928 TaxID=634439 RepID=A0ABN8E0G9_9VIBR|nr:DUF2975 domain-containing protein [Vibrio marisflavi]CAH0536831.1 hypothetical protein VMF7928_00721 [Vibrio marisflavi CECT 7928]